MRNIQETLSSTYNPKDVEKRLYAFWEERSFFSPEGAARHQTHASCLTPDASYVIVIPPPTATGSLHVGHALNNTLQDALIRFKRMQGYRALWLPGTDHAGIPTQMLVERELKKEGKTRHDIGREALISRVWQWKEKYGDIIINQLKMLGCSCDWSRQRFTMDDGYTKAVQEAFIHLYNKGCIYRGNRIINWCVTCQTAVSDLEIVYRETKGKLYYFRYPIIQATGNRQQATAENSAGSDPDKRITTKGSDPIYIVIATTRPETMLGDTAVAVNPEDERYAKSVGKKILLPLMNREIPLISDSFVDKTFGTGAVKITPFHDPNDFEAGLRHELPSVQVIGFDGKMTQGAGKYAAMKRDACREQILKDLEEQGLIEKIEDYTHSLSCHDRCGEVLEPLVSLQWFVSMKKLAEPAIQCVKDGRVKFHPERFAKMYLDWMENIKDWCISRQIWWGHRIPVWYCEEGAKAQRDKGTQAAGENGAGSDPDKRLTTQGSDPIYTGCKPIASKEKPSECPVCHDKNLVQDNDVLDAWFSSALWPFATLGWPEKTKDLQSFYPTTTLSTGRDIINLWVARMLMTGLEFMGDVPFSDVYIHPTILNEQGKRMSKSLGTGVDPLELMEKYGTDATRFGLILNCTKGQDVRFSERMIENTRNFCNKLWNASRFVMMNLENREQGEEKAKLETLNLKPETLSVADKWILSRCNKAIRDVTEYLEHFDFHEACQTLYEFFWGDFCDWYLEIAKIDLYEATGQQGSEASSDGAGSDTNAGYTKQGSDTIRKGIVQWILHNVLSQTLKLLHPFLPFITEEIYIRLNPHEKSIMISAWPSADEKQFNEEAEKEMGNVQELVSAIRNLRHELKIPPSQKVAVFAKGGDEGKNIAERHKDVIAALAKCDALQFDGNVERARMLSSRTETLEIYLPIPKEFDIQKEIVRLKKELLKLTQEHMKLQRRLADASFLKGAPEHVVESEKEKLKQFEKQIAHIHERLELYKDLN